MGRLLPQLRKLGVRIAYKIDGQLMHSRNPRKETLLLILIAGEHDLYWQLNNLQWLTGSAQQTTHSLVILMLCALMHTPDTESLVFGKNHCSMTLQHNCHCSVSNKLNNLVTGVQGRIRGTYGINAKPVAVETPADSPPAPGVTRASLRPKPTAKASPDDEEVETVKPAGSRHLRAVSSGPDAGAAHDSPGSPMHIKASAPEGQYQTPI